MQIKISPDEYINETGIEFSETADYQWVVKGSYYINEVCTVDIMRSEISSIKHIILCAVGQQDVQGLPDGTLYRYRGHDYYKHATGVTDRHGEILPFDTGVTWGKPLVKNIEIINMGQQ